MTERVRITYGVRRLLVSRFLLRKKYISDVSLYEGGLVEETLKSLIVKEIGQRP